MYLEVFANGSWYIHDSRPSVDRQLKQGNCQEQMLFLAGKALHAELTCPGLHWWQRWILQLFAALACDGCEGLQNSASWQQRASRQLELMPMFQGSCHVRLQHLLGQLEELAQIAAAKSDVSEWLQSLHPHWGLVGKIVMHLAETPAPSTTPFARLVTWVEKIGSGKKPQHLPLGRAMQSERAGQIWQILQQAATAVPWLQQAMAANTLLNMQTLDSREAYDFLLQVDALQNQGIITMVPDWWQKKARRVQMEVQLGQRSVPGAMGGVAGLNYELSLHGKPLSQAERQLIEGVERGLVLLRGEWVEVDNARLQHLRQAWQKLEQLCEHGFGITQAMRWALLGPYAGLQAAADDLAWQQVHLGEALQQRLQADSNSELLPQGQVEGLQAKLRGYQLEGLQWMLRMCSYGAGVCLADDMGLGKTLQVIALLWWLKQQKFAESKCFALVLAPASLLFNWRRELQRFAPQLRVYVEHADFNKQQSASREDCDVVISSYGMLRRGALQWKDAWEVLVFDEAQNIKNPASAQAQAMYKVRAAYRIALSGTPIENSAMDVWSIMQVLNPGLLGSANEFEAFLQQVPDSYARVRRLLAPFVLRRLKSDPQVAPELPPKIEKVEYLLPTRQQSILYARLLTEFKTILQQCKPQEQHDEAKQQQLTMQRQGAVLSYLSQFKQLCNHPALWHGQGDFSPQHSAKMLRLGEVATELASRGEALIVFTQYKQMCAPLAEFLAQKMGRAGLMLHGSTPVAQRQALVERFQAADGPPFFVISLKAGGTGLTLTRAHFVLHFDRWWNPAIENQATDRSHRIGQKQQVEVLKLALQGTLEERIDLILSAKQQLADDLLGNSSANNVEWAKMSDEQLLQLLAGEESSQLEQE